MKIQLRKPCYIRINTLRTSVGEIIKYFVHYGYVHVKTPSGFNEFLAKAKSLKKGQFMQDFSVPELLVFAPGTQLIDDPLTLSFSIYVQDKAHCLAVRALSPQPESVVLDMCASPGFKTTHMATLMDNKGKIFALDVNKKRVDILRDVVGRTICSCIKVKCQDSLTFTDGNVEYILVDAPSTSSGVFFIPGRGFVSIEEDEIDKNKIKLLQVKLLKHALLNFPSVKRVVYCTGSLHYEETEGVVEDVIKSKAGFRFSLVKPNFCYSNSSGRGSRLSLEDHLTDPYFIAVFERNNSPVKNVEWKKNINKATDLNESEDETESIDEFDFDEAEDIKFQCGSEHVQEGKPRPHKKKRSRKKVKKAIQSHINRNSELRTEEETGVISQCGFDNSQCKIQNVKIHSEREENLGENSGYRKKRRRRKAQKGKQIQSPKDHNSEIDEEKACENRKKMVVQNKIRHEFDSELSKPVLKKRKNQKQKLSFQVESLEEQKIKGETGNLVSSKNSLEIENKIKTKKKIRVGQSKCFKWTISENHKGSQKE